MAGYVKRKSHQVKNLKETMHKLHHKVKYIKSILSDELDLRRKTQKEIIADLIRLQIEEHDGYNYLIKMPMDSVSNENVIDLQEEHDEIQNELIELEQTSVEKIWIRELTLLKKNS
jgi:hypothetical protein